MSKKEGNGLAEVTLACGVEGCPHGKGITSVKHPGALTAADLKILNRNRWKQPRLTAVQKKRLQHLLNGSLVCPIHGRKHLGYQSTAKITASVEFVIDLGKDEGDPDWEPTWGEI